MHVPTHTKVAMKVYSKNNLTRTRQNSIKQEIEVLMSLEHMSVVKFVDCFTDEKNVYLVLEFAEGKNLY